MSLKSCELKWEEEARFEQQRREWREFYLVEMTLDSDGPLEIMNGRPKLLPPFSPHPKDNDALVAEFWPKRIRGTNFWDVELRYSTDVEVNANPLAQPVVTTITSQIREIPALYDIDGNPVVNTAGDFLTDPPATRKVVDQVIRFTKNIGLRLPSYIQTHPGSVNNDSVRLRGLTYPPGTLFCAGVNVGEENNLPGTTGTVSTITSPPYTTLEGELWYREDGWTELYPNRGYFEIVKMKNGRPELPSVRNAAGKTIKRRVRPKFPAYSYLRRRITIGPLGDYPPEPVFLDADGAAILNPTFDSIIILEYDGNKKRSFNVFPLK